MNIALIKQLDGSKCANANCVAATHAMLVHTVTNGAKAAVAANHSSPFTVQVRDNYGVYCPGIPFSAAASAVQHLASVTMTPRFGITWDMFSAIIDAGHPADISIVYSALHGTPFDSCHTYDGRHSVAVFERRYNVNLNGTEFLVGDPLADHRYTWIPLGPQWWPASLLKKAAALSANGAVNCSIAPIPAGAPTKKLVCATTVRTEPSTVTGTLVGSLPAGTTCTILSSVTGGFWSLTCGGSKTDNVWYKVSAAGMVGFAPVGRF